jgi:hypothetical protein
MLNRRINSHNFHAKTKTRKTKTGEIKSYNAFPQKQKVYRLFTLRDRYRLQGEILLNITILKSTHKT